MGRACGSGGGRARGACGRPTLAAAAAVAMTHLDDVRVESEQRVTELQGVDLQAGLRLIHDFDAHHCGVVAEARHQRGDGPDVVVLQPRARRRALRNARGHVVVPERLERAHHRQVEVSCKQHRAARSTQLGNSGVVTAESGEGVAPTRRAARASHSIPSTTPPTPRPAPTPRHLTRSRRTRLTSFRHRTRGLG